MKQERKKERKKELEMDKMTKNGTGKRYKILLNDINDQRQTRDQMSSAPAGTP